MIHLKADFGQLNGLIHGEVMLLTKDFDEFNLGDRRLQMVIKLDYDVFLELVECGFGLEVSGHEILHGCGNDEILQFEVVDCLGLRQLVSVKTGGRLGFPHSDASLVATFGHRNWQVISNGIIWVILKSYIRLTTFGLLRFATVTSQSHSMSNSSYFEILEAVFYSDSLGIQEDAIVQMVPNFALQRIVKHLHRGDAVFDFGEVHNIYKNFFVEE